MEEEERGSAGLFAPIRANAGPLLGLIGLAAWLALLWFMFGDVL